MKHDLNFEFEVELENEEGSIQVEVEVKANVDRDGKDFYLEDIEVLYNGKDVYDSLSTSEVRKVCEEAFTRYVL